MADTPETKAALPPYPARQAVAPKRAPRPKRRMPKNHRRATTAKHALVGHPVVDADKPHG